MSVVSWKKGIAILASVYVLRMLGMFMVFPVFSLYAQELDGANKTLVGIALGIYGLSQGILQLPFGYLSDKFGRKPVIIIGLLLFLFGSIMAACATSIMTMIIARGIQGMGAISAVTLASVADIIPIEKRGTAMAIIGASIGMAFICALILGPLISYWVGGVDGLFWVISGLVVLAIILVLQLPTTKNNEEESDTFRYHLLWQACFSIMILHAVFTGAFVLLPSIMVNSTGLSSNHHWWIYLPANIIAFLFMRVKSHPNLLNFGVSFFIIAIAFALLTVDLPLWGIVLAVTIFFIGIYRLEMGLPHWVSSIVSFQGRGRAMGYFSTSQFLGSFLGATLSGYLWRISSTYIVLIVLLVITGITGLVLLYWGKHDTLIQ